MKITVQRVQAGERRQVQLTVEGAGGDAKQPVRYLTAAVTLDPAGAARLAGELSRAAGSDAKPRRKAKAKK